jgi:hypothetical protein
MMPIDTRHLLIFFVVMFVLTTIGLTFLLPDQSLGIVYTEYDIISIDNERFTYIDSDNKIRGVQWCDYPRFVNVYPSNRTYLVIETGTNVYYKKYNLYLNASDLE